VPGPPRLDDIDIELEPKGLFAAVRKCLIHNTLLRTPKIRVDLVVQAVRNAA
jgi:hypothetical protein